MFVDPLACHGCRNSMDDIVPGARRSLFVLGTYYSFNHIVRLAVICCDRLECFAAELIRMILSKCCTSCYLCFGNVLPFVKM